MNTCKVIYLDEYKNNKINKQKNKINNTFRPSNYGLDKKKLEEDDRINTFNLFMRVLSTIKEESY